MPFCQCSHIHKYWRPHWRVLALSICPNKTYRAAALEQGKQWRNGRHTLQLLTVSFLWHRFISFYEAIKVNSAIVHLMGFLVLLATVQLWNLLHHNPRLQVISKTLSKAWDEVVGFLLVILILLTGYAIAVSPHSGKRWPWNHIAFQESTVRQTMIKLAMNFGKQN